MARVILVAGTHGLDADWHRPDGAFVVALHDAGHELAGPGYRWTTELDGVVGAHTDWDVAGEALALYARAYAPVDAVIAHSHGGQVAAYALGLHGASWPVLVTLATPARNDLLDVYRHARRHAGRWIHVRSRGIDWWERWGSRRWQDWLQPWRWVGQRRAIPGAELVIVSGVGHGGLLDPELWNARQWWRWLSPPSR